MRAEFLKNTQKEVSPRSLLVAYFIFCYVLNVFFCWNYFYSVEMENVRTLVFSFAIIVTYAFMYLLPVITLAWIIERASKTFGTQFTGALKGPLVVGLATIISILLYADAKLFDLFGFHINGFVFNLLMTPGGLDSLGAGNDSYYSAALALLIMASLHLIAYQCVIRSTTLSNLKIKAWKRLLFPFLILAVFERLLYGISDVQLHAGVYNAGNALPLYNKATFRTKATRLGFKRPREVSLGVSSDKLNYPLNDLKINAVKKNYNIVWLVAESWRWDMLSEEIMPKTVNFSKKAQNFSHHYSSGNGTRQGMFGLFYGVYGSYWDAFLRRKKGPLLIDILISKDYQFNMYTSARFTYPEFDKTVFADISSNKLHELDHQIKPWVRDRENISELIEFVEKRDRTRPFFTFMFFEATHATYNFPEEAAIRKPYLPELNYSKVSKESLRSEIKQLKNRYINASHYLDSQLSRVTDYLENSGLLENTIVVITGDHGEEFMEKGHWGHNAGFTDEQVRTPMVVYIPGLEPQVHNKLTSHLDVIPTIFPLLGVSNPPEDYSQGTSLLENRKEDDYIVISSWGGITYVDEQFKYGIPFKGEFSHNSLMTKSDEKIGDPTAFIQSHGAVIQSLLKNAKVFTGE